jgi:hypothetical protein
MPVPPESRPAKDRTAAGSSSAKTGRSKPSGRPPGRSRGSPWIGEPPGEPPRPEADALPGWEDFEAYGVPTASKGDPENGGGGNGGDEPVREMFFRRTPHMELLKPEPLRPLQTLTVRVFLSREGAPRRDIAGVLIDLPDDLEVLDIDVMLVGSDHFEITGDAIKTLSVHRDDEESEPV